MEELKMMKKNLIACVQSQMANLQETDAKELGEAVDMIKDLAETEYYCSIVKAMEESQEEKKLMEKMPRMQQHFYTPTPPMYYPPYREDMMYYNGGSNSGSSNSGGRSRGRSSGGQMYYEGNMMPIPYYEGTYPSEIRDYREGRSGMSRRNYMESKETHQGKEKKMQELEKYMNELSQDITEMINDAEPDEKATLSQKLMTLAEKIK